jgi:AcrR family transcriptional regulator
LQCRTALSFKKRKDKRGWILASISNDAVRATERKLTVRGRRPGTRTRLQEIQKHSSRQRIVEAASKLFQDNSYNTTTIDDIVAEAGISRVTFYKHFSNKLEVADSIHTQSAIDFANDYLLLAESGDPSEDEILKWMFHLLERYTQSRESITMLAAMAWQEPLLIRSRAGAYANIIRGWGATIPAFRKATSGEDEEAQILAHLLLVQMNELLYELTVVGWEVNHRTALRVVARQFRSFIQAGA